MFFSTRWAVDITTIDGDRIDGRTGVASNVDGARVAAIAAARDYADTAAADCFPCYVFSINGQMTAFVATGARDDGTGPDHDRAAIALSQLGDRSFIGPVG